MEVKADQPQLARGQSPPDRPLSRAVLEAEAELGVELARLDIGVGRGLDARGHPDHHVLLARQHPLAALDLVEGVQDQVADSGLLGEPDLGIGLVVAVHVDPRGFVAGRQGHGQLAPRGDID